MGFGWGKTKAGLANRRTTALTPLVTRKKSGEQHLMERMVVDSVQNVEGHMVSVTLLMGSSKRLLRGTR